MLQFADILQTTPNEIVGWKASNGNPINNFSATVFAAARNFTQLPEDLQITVGRICDPLMEATKKKR